MDNQENLQQGAELPRPNQDVVQPPPESSSESMPSSEPIASPPPVASPVVSAQTASSIQSIVGNTASAVDPAVTHSSDISAADVDLIEKEWVQKAKAIVEHTIGDPFTQNKEINKIKADYIKKRYNKDIKQVSE
ncbi:MAG: hypothetical protein WCJ60_01895 [bacterium]